MALPTVHDLLAKEFDIVKLDFDRGIGAKDIEKRYIAQEQGLPWFAFLAGDGTLLASSTGPHLIDVTAKDGTTSQKESDSNVGEPYQPGEVAYFKTMLEKARQRLTDADIEALINSLVEANKASGG
jgi:hypothetical protein